jgi:hypothetical protein
MTCEVQKAQAPLTSGAIFLQAYGLGYVWNNAWSLAGLSLPKSSCSPSSTIDFERDIMVQARTNGID